MRHSLLATLLATSALLPVVALAQTATDVAGDGQTSGASAPIEEIVVTAQKRAESVQKTPLAVTAITGDTLRNQGISDVGSLSSSIPTLQIGQSYGSANIALRGISLNAVNFGAENPIAFHMDGVFVARPAAVLDSFYDMQRVEVLRGAQGTLYGRNATGGSINLITADPTEGYSGYTQLTYGEYNHVASEGGFGGPLGSDKLLFRVAFHTDDRDGWGKNEFTGRDIDDNHERAGRLKLLYQPLENLKILFSADYSQQDDHQTAHYGGTPLGLPPGGVTLYTPLGPIDLGGSIPRSTRDVSIDSQPKRHNRFWGASTTIDWTIGELESLDFLGALELKSITAYRGSNTFAEGDLDQTSFSLSSVLLKDHSRQVSQEFQFSGTSDHAHWIAGLYYFHEVDHGHVSDGFNTVDLNLFGIPVPAPGYLAQGYYAGSKVGTDAYAAFGQYTRELIDKLSLTVGARYSIERKDAINQGAFDLITPFSEQVAREAPNPAALSVQCGAGLPTIGYGTQPCIPHKTFYAFTPKGGLEYQATPDTLIYASVSRGFKSGVYNLGAAQPPVKPEKITDYEAGLKSTILDGNLRFNLSGFYYDYADLQVNKVVFTNVILENAAAAKIYGIEPEIVANLARGLQVDLTGAYLHSEFTNYITADNARPAGDGHTLDEFGNPAFNLKGNRLPQAPEISGQLGVNYTLPLDGGALTFRGEAVYTSKVYWTPFNLNTEATKDRTRFNMSARFESEDGHWVASLNARNIFDKVAVTNGFVPTGLVGFAINGYTEPPRTIDFTVGYHL